MPQINPKDPLHGVTLETIVTELVKKHGWGALYRSVPARCFQYNPSVKSSLTFLRKTPWARKRIEDWFAHELIKSVRGPVRVQTPGAGPRPEQGDKA